MAYLAGHNRPVHEVLAPRLKPLAASYDNQFSGMTREVVSLEALDQIRAQLVLELPRALTDQHRSFLRSLVQNKPLWDCMPFSHLQELPAIRWKLQNLAKLRGKKRDEQIERLETCFQHMEEPA